METFSTQNGQNSVAINSSRGTRISQRMFRFLGQAILRGIPEMPAGVPGKVGNF